MSAGTRVFTPTESERVRRFFDRIPNFHTSDHADLPTWHPERKACSTCTPDSDLAA